MASLRILTQTELVTTQLRFVFLISFEPFPNNPIDPTSVLVLDFPILSPKLLENKS